MEPQRTTIVLTPHDDDGKWSVQIHREGLFSDETTALYGRTGLSEEEVNDCLTDAITDAFAHERLSKRLNFG